MDELGTHELEKGKKYRYDLPISSDEIEYEDEFGPEDDKLYQFKGEKESSHVLPKKFIEKYLKKHLEEQGFTGGGNAPDMDLSNIDSAYSFKSKGPKKGDGPYDEEADDMDLDDDQEWDAYNFESGGADEVYPVFEEMKSAWDDDDELEEGANDVSGAQGIYRAMDQIGRAHV